MVEKDPEIDSGNSQANALDTLKDLLLKPEENRIRHIEHRLDDPMTRAREISRTLPEAISLSVMDSSKLSRVIRPVIDDSLKSSVKKNPKAIADAIFPALGPGIRKAISSTILGMIQSLNQVLNHSFSLQGLKWRFEALRTGKPFGEVVLINTLMYQVEQIFLIHRESGIVLEHVVARDTMVQDPDLVSGMLTAIQDFVKDSFTTDGDSQELDTLRMGSDKSIWIEQGEHALIASVIRGTPPMDLRTRYREAIEEIHLKAGGSLSDFDGDPFPFAIFRDLLKQGLSSQEKPDVKRQSPLLWILALALAAATLFTGFSFYKSRQAWQEYLAQLEGRKGIILLSARKIKDRHQVHALKDPLVENLPLPPEAKGLFPIKTQFHWTPFYSLDQELVLERARKRLSPPPGIDMTLRGAKLTVKGRADGRWIQALHSSVLTIPGIDSYDDSLVINKEQGLLDDALIELASQRVYFKTNSISLVPDQENVLGRITGIVKKINSLSIKVKTPLQIVILGHTDSSGTEKRNLKLSRDRAEKILQHLVLNGASPSLIRISGVGTQSPLSQESSSDDRQMNRAVSFKIFNAPKGNQK